MTPTEALQNHLSLCDEVHQLALEENRFLKQNQRPPDTALLDRKRALLVRLDESLTELKANSTPAPGRPDPVRKDTIEKARAKILQILHLDRENEQLLLRFSLSGARPTTTVAPTPPPVSHVQRIYDRHA